MSYSISFLPPSQSRAASIARPHNGTQPTSTAGTSCQESRTYLNKLNEQQQALVKPLIARVEHWKGHCLCSFGKPLLQAKAMVSRIPVGGETHTHEITTRQYQIFLFSNILICCRKRSQPNAQGRDWTMKGRVFLRNIYDVQRTGDTTLHISYHGDDGSDDFTIHFARPALLGRWANVLETFRERATEPRALEEGSSHSDLPPPAYYSPLPEYRSASNSTLYAPPMERHSPLSTPLSTPPLYTPSDNLNSPLDSRSPFQYPCRPAMHSSISASTIGSGDFDHHTMRGHDQSVHHPEDALEKTSSLSTQCIKFANSLISAMASGPAIYQSLALLSVCLYITYLGLSYRPAWLREDVISELH